MYSKRKEQQKAVIEPFFSAYKARTVYLKQYNSAGELKKEIKKYIICYNNDRIKLNLNMMSPI